MFKQHKVHSILVMDGLWVRYTRLLI